MLHAVGNHGEHGSAYGDTECVARNKLPGLRNRNVQIVGDVRQKTHNNKLGHADGEGSNGET